MVNKLVFIVVLVLIFVLGYVVFVNADEIINVEADIIVPEKIVKIQIPEYVYLGNLTVGYNMKTDEIKVEINNTGTVNVTVTPSLVNSSEEIFSYLYFTERLSGDRYGWDKIGDWDMDIEKPDDLGGERKDWFYMKLDLSNYTRDIEDSMFGYKRELVFIAVED